jgi:REP element-mobilizing transposase RayT
MARLARAEIFDPHEITALHVMAKTNRKCFLLGVDEQSGKNFDYRKDWIEARLKVMAAHFGIDLIAFACMSNHIHLVLRSRPDVVTTWTDSQVAERWWYLCPKRRVRQLVDGKQIRVPAEPTKADLNAICKDPEHLAMIRTRLSDVSWWMRLLCQYIAMRANGEEGTGLGRFWQCRFKAVRLLDAESLLACSAYVDLNPIRAAIAETLELSNHTSIQRRIQALQASQSETTPPPDSPAITSNVTSENNAPTESRHTQRPDSFLSPIGLDPTSDPMDPMPSRGHSRCSDQGVFEMPVSEYILLLDWLARNVVANKKGSTPVDAAPIFERLKIDPNMFLDMAKDFGKSFKLAAGKPQTLASARSKSGHRFYRSRT